MEALIPKLFILSAEASIVLFLILIVIIIFNSKAKRKDINAAKEMVVGYVSKKDERIASLKKQLQNIGFNGNLDEHAAQLYEQEKSLIKEFVSLYLQHDVYRLLDYPENIMEVDNHFLKTSGSAAGTTQDEATINSSEEKANAAILAREQEESNGEQLKELSELRLKNTELNEHLFEALETITELMTEHGKKTGQEVDSNAQKVLEAIIYLRDKRLGKQDETNHIEPPALNTEHKAVEQEDMIEEDATLDDSTVINLDLNENLEADLDSLEEEPAAADEAPAEEADPWADALTEQAEAEAESQQNTQKTQSETEAPVEDDPWADALSEQAEAEAGGEQKTQEKQNETESPVEDDDPWAAALSEQAEAEAGGEQKAQEKQNETESPVEDDDPWADALAEQAGAESESGANEEDPWADALAEQATAEASKKEDPWADALAEQEESEKK
ncbi:MAG: hypothetical protein KZQ83_20320 [gamma proteobacterium symbiont of Taylorina sp.]|nr:hypothetical protein [gamma proteobacterium symbiont of Taylorina sp.]